METTNEIIFTEAQKQELLDLASPTIKSSLKAPLTAVFCPPEELAITKDDSDLYYANGYIDSQNSYGAMIRTTFTARAKLNNGKWELVNTSVYNQAAKNLGGALAFGIIITAVLFAIFYFILK